MSIAEMTLKAGKWHVTNWEYHADTTFVSNSALNEFRRWSPTYYARYVAGTMEKRQPTDEMKFGTAFHSFVLEPKTFGDHYVIYNEKEFNRRTKVGKQEWQDFVLQNEGKTFLTEEQMAALCGMFNSLQQNSQASSMIKQEFSIEQPLVWQNPSTDIWCKIKPDVLASDLGIIVDIKTASDTTQEAWLRQAGNLGYHRQAAMYIDGVRYALNNLGCQFVHIVVGTQEPYPVVCYALGDESIALGRRQYQSSLKSLAVCRGTGVWTDPTEVAINVVELPPWNFKE